MFGALTKIQGVSVSQYLAAITMGSNVLVIGKRKVHLFVRLQGETLLLIALPDATSKDLPVRSKPLSLNSENFQKIFPPKLNGETFSTGKMGNDGE